MYTKLHRLLVLLHFSLCARFVLSLMQLHATGSETTFPAKKQTTLFCSWKPQSIVLQPEDPYPLKFTRAETNGKYTIPMPVAREAEVRSADGKEFSITYGFTVQRSDNMASVRCQATARGQVYQEKTMTLLVKDGPAKPILKGPSTVPLEEKGVWICTVDCATEAYPKVSISLSKDQDVLEACSDCLSTKKTKYTDANKLNNYKVVVLILTLAVQSMWKAGDTFSMTCTSEYTLLPQGARDSVSDELLVTIEAQGTDSDGSKTSGDSGSDKGSSSSLLKWWVISVCIVTVVLGAGALCLLLCRRRRLKSRASAEGSDRTKPEDRGLTKPEDSGRTKPEGMGLTKPEDSGRTKPEGMGLTKPEDSGRTKPVPDNVPGDIRKEGNRYKIDVNIPPYLIGTNTSARDNATKPNATANAKIAQQTGAVQIVPGYGIQRPKTDIAFSANVVERNSPEGVTVHRPVITASIPGKKSGQTVPFYTDRDASKVVYGSDAFAGPRSVDGSSTENDSVQSGGSIGSSVGSNVSADNASVGSSVDEFVAEDVDEPPEEFSFDLAEVEGKVT